LFVQVFEMREVVMSELNSAIDALTADDLHAMNPKKSQAAEEQRSPQRRAQDEHRRDADEPKSHPRATPNVG